MARSVDTQRKTTEETRLAVGMTLLTVPLLRKEVCGKHGKKMVVWRGYLVAKHFAKKQLMIMNAAKKKTEASKFSDVEKGNEVIFHIAKKKEES